MKQKTFLGMLLAISALLLSTQVSALGTLDNPTDNSMQSGQILIYGWHCDADKIEIAIDDRPIKTVAYGMPRPDTEGKCGDIDNGFAFVFSSSLLNPEETHTIRALADGVEFDSVQFTVDNFDSSFIRELYSFVEITVPELGKEAVLLWQDSLQGYVITDVHDLDFTLEDALNAAAGHWSGYWTSAWAGPGHFDITMEIVETEGGKTIQPTSVGIRYTGCAEESEQATPIMSLDRMVSKVIMQDGSEIEMQFLPSESLTTAAGTFVFDSGPCEGLDGIFYMAKIAQ